MADAPEFAVVRHRQRGDVLLCSAVVRALHIDHPGAQIYVRTLFPEIFENNPRVVRAGPGECGTPKCRVYNMDAVHYEKMQGWNLIDAFGHAAGYARGTCPHTVEMYLRPEDDAWVQRTLPESVRKKFAVVAPGPGLWEGRNWSEKKWTELINELLLDMPVVLVGGLQEQGGPASYKLPSTVDLRGKTASFSHLAASIFAARLFVGIDGFPCHVAGAMRTPRCVLFGLTSPELILCDAPNTVSVISSRDHPFTGARHRVDSFMQIDVTGRNPMDTITVEQVLDTLDPLI